MSGPTTRYRQRYEHHAWLDRVMDGSAMISWESSCDVSLGVANWSLTLNGRSEVTLRRHGRIFDQSTKPPGYPVAAQNNQARK